MALTKASLICDEPPGRIEFMFNPETITIRRKSKPSEKPSASTNAGGLLGSLGVIFAGADMPKLTLMFDLDGPETKNHVELILKWMSPVPSSMLAGVAQEIGKALGGKNVGVNQAAKLPTVTFVWGTGFLYPANITNLNAKYTRFNQLGNPTRAKIQALDLTATPKKLPGTNPTSGGAPGRLSHVLTSGESILSVAQNRYGNLRYWRALAEANEIDDPIRVHPGRRVYLPSTEELVNGQST